MKSSLPGSRPADRAPARHGGFWTGGLFVAMPSPLVITIHRERRHVLGEPAPRIAANIAGMAARQPRCHSAAIMEPAGTAQRTGTPRAEVPSCWDGTELKLLTRHKLQTGCPAMLFIDY